MDHQISDILLSLTKHGCHQNLDGNMFTISKINTWKAFRVLQEYSNYLATLALAKEIFSTPYTEKEPLIISNVQVCHKCEHSWSYKCPYHGKKELVPSKVMANGCDLYQENTTIYF